MTYQSYELSRYIGDDTDQSTSFTVADDDAINCAHMLAAGFNTMSRNMMGDFVLAVVDTKAGTVQYDGKIEKFDRPEPKSERKTELCGMTYGPALYGHEGTMCNYSYGHRGECGRTEDAPEPSKYDFISRPVLEAAYDELQAVKEVLFDAGVETIPVDAGVKDLLAVKHVMSQQITRRDVEISELVQERANANEAARAELIEYVKGERAKWLAADKRAPVNHEHMRAWFRGVLDVLAKFLVVTGEADASEGHAVARRLCEVPDGEV